MSSGSVTLNCITKSSVTKQIGCSKIIIGIV